MRVKVAGTGLAYDSVDEAVADVDRMEELRDVEVADLREAGNEAGADRAADKWNRQIQKTRDAIRGAQEREARATSQPRNRPRPARRRASTSSTDGGGGQTPVGLTRPPGRLLTARRRPGGRPRLALRRGLSGRVLRETGAAGVAGSTTKLVLQLFGLLVGLALVLVLLEAEQTQRSVARGLVDFLVNAVGAIVDPVDPFSRAAWTAPAAATPVPATSPRRPARPTVIR